jgi:trehalose 6-phosphate synthase
MTERPVIVASNRGPVTFERDETGELQPRRGAGGLVTALVGALQDAGGLWVAAAMSDGDRELVARSGGGRIDMGAFGASYGVRYLDIEPDVFDAYYNHISNRVLWFMHHYLWDTVRSPAFGDPVRVAWEHYVDVNRRFAQALAEEGERADVEPAYLIQDYHLALVPRFLRELRPKALIAHFSHTSVAGPTYFRMLPDSMHEHILDGMLGADVLGFHSPQWAENFMLSARWRSGARVDLGRSRIRADGRDVAVRVHPISVDGPAMREQGNTREVRDERRWLNRWKGDTRLILRVDRLELTKNIVRGFQALVSLGLRDHREADPGVARRRLDDGATGLELAGRLGRLDHAQGDPVLHRPSRVHVLDLGQHHRRGAVECLRQPQQRGVADQVQE